MSTVLSEYMMMMMMMKKMIEMERMLLRIEIILGLYVKADAPKRYEISNKFEYYESTEIRITLVLTSAACSMRH